jgi:hypothetical protein
LLLLLRLVQHQLADPQVLQGGCRLRVLPQGLHFQQ